jgi:hypothetical protein
MGDLLNGAHVRWQGGCSGRAHGHAESAAAGSCAHAAEGQGADWTRWQPSTDVGQDTEGWPQAVVWARVAEVLWKGGHVANEACQVAAM